MLRATGLVQTHTTLADCLPAAAGLFNSLEDIEPLLLLSPTTLSPGPSCECEVSTSSFVLTGFFEEVPSPNPVGSLSGWLREPKKSHLGSGHCLLLRHEQWAMTHHDAAQKKKTSPLHLPRSYCACFLLRQIPSRPQHFCSVFSCSQSGARMSRKRKRSRLDTRAVPSSVNEPEVDSFGAVIQSGDGPGGEACPFLSRFLLLPVIFGRCPFSGLEP